MRVRGKPVARADAVVVEHPERTEAHVRRVVVLAEREAVAAVEPPKIRAATFRGGTTNDHLGFPP
jgi:hypothetical protein